MYSLAKKYKKIKIQNIRIYNSDIKKIKLKK